MKRLFTILLIAFASVVNAQCIEVCSTCTTPQFHPTGGIVIDGSSLWINWLNPWGFPSASECSKGISFVIDGVEYFANSANYVHPPAASGALVGGYNVVPGATICVVLRNYCSMPYTCDPSNYVESAPLCITSPQAASVTPCKVGTKYVVERNGTTALVNKLRCQRLVSQGWTSSCNCQ